MPKLLDVIKEKGLTHEQVLDMLENMKDEEPEVVEEVIETTEEEPPADIPESVEEVIEEPPEIKNDEVAEPELYTVSQDELTKLISDAVEEKLKARRGAPSKGKVVDKTQLHKEPATKSKREAATEGWFEVIV